MESSKFKVQSSKLEKGQVLLIVILIMVVALTIGLSAASRSITNLRISTDEASSQKAFSAAEAGIERALKVGTGISDQPLGNDSIIKNVSVTTLTDKSVFFLNGGNLVAQDDGVDVWLSTYPDFSNPVSPTHFSIAWGFPGQTCLSSPMPAAMEAIVTYGPKTSPTSSRYAYDPCSRGNNFTVPETASPPSIDGKNLPFYTKSNGNGSINVANALIVRVTPLYNSSIIGVKACSTGAGGGSCTNLPEQGKIIESTGVSGGTSRKVVYYEGFRKLPSEFFQYILFSP